MNRSPREVAETFGSLPKDTRIEYLRMTDNL